MLERLTSLSVYNYLYAAALALFITFVVTKFLRLREAIKNDELAMEVKNTDKHEILERCAKMFPIETVIFNGKVFKKGMNIRITTMQKKVFQGEFVGKNDMDVICILTREHIIAHEVKKISDMIDVEDVKAE
ncbi:hypothetical protein IMSAG049_00141 [Clostridiales bacterium]|nr:hypothetical protein IMSAG049_00141 [Clostridiales bacterium]